MERLTLPKGCEIMRHARDKYLSIGSVSRATLREEDLIPAIVYALRNVRGVSRRAGKLLTEFNKLDTDDPESLERMSYILEGLYNLADSACPPFCYFSATEGDGSDIGCWPSFDSLEEATRYEDPEVWKDPDDGSKVPRSAKYRMVVSDHGNVSLYYRNGREVWGVV